VLFGATSIGRDLAPRIAARIKAGIVTECIALRIDKDGLTVTKPIYDGKMFANVLCQSASTYVVTIPPGAMGMNQPAKSPEVKTIKVTPILGAETSRIKFLDFIAADPKTIDLTEAEIIVAAGRGVGKAENFHLIEELGGSVGGTRPVVDAGWLPPERQIGLTGKFVSPKLFIACGISGQYHHTAGMKDSLIIVAINTDSNAAIFKLADLGIIEDLHEVIPAVIKQLQARRKEEQ
jgi:electron transfer flavoprotein alpha subunit